MERRLRDQGILGPLEFGSGAFALRFWESKPVLSFPLRTPRCRRRSRDAWAAQAGRLVVVCSASCRASSFPGADRGTQRAAAGSARAVGRGGPRARCRRNSGPPPRRSSRRWGLAAADEMGEDPGRLLALRPCEPAPILHCANRGPAAMSPGGVEKPSSVRPASSWFEPAHGCGPPGHRALRERRVTDA